MQKSRVNGTNEIKFLVYLKTFLFLHQGALIKYVINFEISRIFLCRCRRNSKDIERNRDGLKFFVILLFIFFCKLFNTANVGIMWTGLKTATVRTGTGGTRRRTRVVQLAQIPRAFAARRSVAAITGERRPGKV